MMWDFLPPDAFEGREPSQAESSVELECHSCGHATTGYQMGELMVEQGWRLHSVGVGKPFFVLCGECEARYSERWERRAA